MSSLRNGIMLKAIHHKRKTKNKEDNLAWHIQWGTLQLEHTYESWLCGSTMF